MVDMEYFLMGKTTYVTSVETATSMDKATESIINHAIMTQLGMKKGIKEFREAGVRSILKEMKHFHDREVVRPIKTRDVTMKVKYKALTYLMFLKKELNGDIKTRGYTDG